LYLFPNGDKWVKFEQGGSAIGWVAVIHAGKPYGTLTEIVTDPDPEPPVSAFPESFTLVNPDGSKAEYQFVRIIQ
jgi:hypothetical protein